MESEATRIWQAREKLREAAGAVTDLISDGVRTKEMERAAEKMDVVDAEITGAMNAQAGEDLDKRLRIGEE